MLKYAPACFVSNVIVMIIFLSIYNMNMAQNILVFGVTQDMLADAFQIYTYKVLIPSHFYKWVDIVKQNHFRQVLIKLFTIIIRLLKTDVSHLHYI